VKKKKIDKYKGHFDHWLSMYYVHQDNWTVKSIEEQIELYKGMEGDEEYEELKEEVKQILLNKDLDIFLNKGMNRTKLSDLELMANVMIAST
jgi:hypothetical protein